MNAKGTLGGIRGQGSIKVENKAPAAEKEAEPRQTALDNLWLGVSGRAEKKRQRLSSVAHVLTRPAMAMGKVDELILFSF